MFGRFIYKNNKQKNAANNQIGHRNTKHFPRSHIVFFVGDVIGANVTFSVKKEVLQLFVSVLFCACVALFVEIQLNSPASSGYCLVWGFMGGCKLLEVQT